MTPSRFAAAVLLLLVRSLMPSPGHAQVKPVPLGRPAAPVAPATPPGKAGIPVRPGANVGVESFRLPTVSYGTPQDVTGKGPRTGLPISRQVMARVGGQDATGKVLRLRGMAAIDAAQGIPDGAKRLLQVHVRTLNAGDVQDYIVNTELAERWIAAHPVADDIKPPQPSHRSTCGGVQDYATRADCDRQAAGDAVKGIQDEAKKTWNHASDELTHDWNMAAGCFEDHTLSLGDIPVAFSIAPSMSIPLASSSTTSSVTGMGFGSSSSGKVEGSVGLTFPMESDFKAHVDLFYLPCLPFVVRPRSISAAGTMDVGEALTATVSAQGQFRRTYRIPPSGGPKIPIQVIPIVIGGVPVAELDVSAYIEGNVEIGGKGKAQGQFKFEDPHKARFDFTCDGGGCSSGSQQLPAPTKISESAQIKGQVYVKPSVYIALQLDFDYDLLSARAGPQPYLLAMASGCGEASATQASNGQSTSEQNYALTADLDWGVELRAEALVADKIVGKPFKHSVTGDKHLWFSDLAPGGSTALIADVRSAAPAVAAKPALYTVKMPICYPYTNRMRYRVTWTGEATPARTTACQWQANSGTCDFDPTQNLSFNLTWAAAGTQFLTVVPVSDDHERKFPSSAQPTRLEVTIAPPGT